MISRYIVIVLAFGVALFQASRGNWLEATGLFGLGGGLALLRFGPKEPRFRRAAYVCFAVTAIAIILVLVRRY